MMKSNKIKVKVAFGQAKLVVPCGNTTDKVERLIEDINRRFQSHLGDPTARAKELLTYDGYLLNTHDIIEDVVDNGETLCALDFPTWLKLHLPLLEKGAHKVARLDQAGSGAAPSRYAEVGKHKHNKIYVKIGGSNDVVDRLELFDADALKTFVGDKDGKALIAHKAVKDGAWDWNVEVHFIVEKGVVVAAQLAVKATSDARAHIEVVSINIADLTLGTAKVVQTSSLGKPNKTYELPAPVREGPAFEAEKDFQPRHLAPTGRVEPPVPENNEATGDLGLQIKQKDACQPDQAWAESDGYWNKFYNNFSIFNPLETDVTVVKVTSEYEKNGEWVPMDTTLGGKQGYYNYQFNSRLEGFTMEPSDGILLATNSYVKVNARQFDRERRAHNSLPSPLRIRITFEGKEGKKSVIVVEHKNEPLYLATKESREVTNKRPVAFFVAADDLDAEGRVWAEIVEVPEQKRLEYTRFGSSSTLFINKNIIDKILFEAKKDGKTELPMTNFSNEDQKQGTAVRVTALVDLENQWVYAIRVEVQTNTSRAVDHYVLPDIFA